MERLLHPVDTETLELTRYGECIFEGPRRLSVPGQAPALVAVDEELEPVADAAAHGFERLHIVVPVAAMETNLQRPKSCCSEALRLLRERAGIAQHAGGCIRPYAVGQAAEQPPARLPCDLAREVPQR